MSSDSFWSVEDSPQFKSKVTELDEAVNRLDKRCQKVIKGSHKYKDGLATISQQQLGFADTLEDFCGGTDEESLMLGGGLMSRFIDVFRELGSFSEVLQTQLELLLCERLQQTWAKKLIPACRDARRTAERSSSECDAARQRVLGHNSRPHFSDLSSKWKRETPERTQERARDDLVRAEAMSEEARFDLARKLTLVDAQQRYSFLEATVSAMDAHMRYYQRSAEVMKSIEPFLHQALEKVEQLKAAEALRCKSLEAVIGDFKQQQAKQRQAADAVEAAHRGEGSIRQGEPVQFSNEVEKLREDFKLPIRASSDSNGADVVALKQGYLHKKSTGMIKEWKRRYFVLDSMGMLYYYSAKDRQDGQKTPQNTVSLLTAAVKTLAGEGVPPYAFTVVSPAQNAKAYMLQADSEGEQRQWMAAIQAVTACLLNDSPLDARQASMLATRKPSMPTRVRNSSLDASDPDALPSVDGLAERLGGAASLATSASGSLTEEAWSPSRSHRDMAQLAQPAGSGGTPRAARQGSISEPSFQLRQVTGNHICADCGAPEPTWASLNLGILMCIDCSGAHRRLGVHISKVRSLTLDVRVWDDPGLMAMMDGLGNASCNEVWEETLLHVHARADSWVWCDDEEEGQPAVSMVSSPRQQPEASLKPRPDHSKAAKEAFVLAKYQERRFVAMHAADLAQLPGSSLQDSLWTAVAQGSLQLVMRCLVGGADLQFRYTSFEAMQLAADAQSHVDAMNVSAPADVPGIAGLTILHAAVQASNIPVLEYLLQNGASIDAADLHGRAPLHYAAIFDRLDAAQRLLKHRATRGAKDQAGRTAFNMAVLCGAGVGLLSTLAEEPARPARPPLNHRPAPSY